VDAADPKIRGSGGPGSVGTTAPAVEMIARFKTEYGEAVDPPS
jgi:hypothetical protein